MYRKLILMFVMLVSLPQGCTTTSCPDCFVNVPINDSTVPTLASMIVSDQGTFTFNQSSQATTIIAVSDVVSVLASARDDDGGLKAVRIWSTTTYFSTGQVVGPGTGPAGRAHGR